MVRSAMLGRKNRMGVLELAWHTACMTNYGVRLEVATPGVRNAGGVVRAGFAETPFGLCLMADNLRGICGFSFVEEPAKRAAWAALCKAWPGAECVRDDSRAGGWCQRLFAAPGSENGRIPNGHDSDSLTLFVSGTPFQVKVWRALLQIPAGTLVSYGRVAEWIGHPGASRAVGTAVGNNPIGYLIPCHRVIRGNGAIGGYAWGVERKRVIQVWERALLEK